MKKIQIFIIVSLFQAASLSALSPAVSQLRGQVPANYVPAEAAAPAAAPVKGVQVILNTQTGHTHTVLPAGGGFIDTATGQFYSAVFNGSGYILPNGQYLPIVGGRDGGAEGRWAAIVEKTLAYGMIKVPNGNVPAGRYFADISGAQNATHSSDYFSVWGRNGEDGAFMPEYATMVSEKWELTAGTWRIDQWLHWVGLDGAPLKNEHTVLVEEMDGSVVSMQSEKPGVEAPEAQANRNSLMIKWDLYIPAERSSR